MLQAGKHTYVSGDGPGVPTVSSSGSLFLLLQNDAGRACFGADEVSVLKIIGTMSVKVSTHPSNDLPLVTTIGFGSEYPPKESPLTPQSGYFEALPPVSPDHQQPGRTDFGAIGSATLTNAFSPSEVRRVPRRGRIFDLIDDVDDDNLDDVEDVVSGMLNNLNVDLFQNNSSQDVDIEAIGIGAEPSGSLQPGHSHSRGRFS